MNKEFLDRMDYFSRVAVLRKIEFVVVEDDVFGKTTHKMHAADFARLVEMAQAKLQPTVVDIDVDASLDAAFSALGLAHRLHKQNKELRERLK